jgi:transcriptional regulator with XRE-family HTH domain
MSRSIGQMIKAARVKRGLTCGAVAYKADLSEATVKRIERGWPPSVQSLQAVAKVLGLKVRVGA